MESEEFSIAFEGKSVDAEFVKNILDENSIECFLKDDNMGQLFPLFVTHGGINPVKVFVFQKDIDEAKKIIATYTGS
ncbi:MAG: putative signal transducing protein [Candidatus Kariarchaeaceae archaeon]